METEIQYEVAALSRIEAVKIILKSLCDITGLRYSVVARLTDETWTACAIHDDMNFGLEPGSELVLRTTYCNTIREQNAPLLIRHASVEPEFQNHPALKNYAVESYIGVPLYRRNGEYFGVLCALDLQPKAISERNIEVFKLMAKLIAFELEADERQHELKEALKLANQTNEARARFMSILGHDLRNPLNTIVTAANLLEGGKLDADRSRRMAETIARTGRRMGYLIADLLDAAQTSQGNRISIQKKGVDLNDVFEPLINEFRLTHPNRTIDYSRQGHFYGDWDEGRLGQVLSNLLSNALSYGKSEQPVRISLVGENGGVRLQVNNRGEVIAQEIRENLFTPFWRGAKRFGADANSSGLGLGLYIVKQIVEAHGGMIDVESNEDRGTTFTVTLPHDSEI